MPATPTAADTLRALAAMALTMALIAAIYTAGYLAGRRQPTEIVCDNVAFVPGLPDHPEQAQGGDEWATCTNGVRVVILD